MKHKLTLALMIAVASSTLAASDTVKIDTGRLKGVTAGGVTSFKGIPYAAAPVGELRWRPPQPVKPWTDLRPASQYGADCMQKPFPGDAAPLGVTPAEDCLYMNVWIPASAPAKKLPVLVWIYGGGFVNGGSSPAVYDGSQFAKRGKRAAALSLLPFPMSIGVDQPALPLDGFAVYHNDEGSVPVRSQPLLHCVQRRPVGRGP